MHIKHLLERLVISIGETIVNLSSPNLWLTIVYVVVVTQLLRVILFGVGLIIGETAGFFYHVVDVVFDLVNTVANDFSKAGHGIKDFFTGHFSRLSHEGDYATRVHLKVPPVLSQLAQLATDIKHGGKMPEGRALSIMLQMVAARKICPALAYFRTISLTRWIINGLVDAFLPELCKKDLSQPVLIVMFIFDALPIILGWIGTTGVILWLVVIKGWPLIRCNIKIVFDVLCFVRTEIRELFILISNCIHSEYNIK